MMQFTSIVQQTLHVWCIPIFKTWKQRALIHRRTSDSFRDRPPPGEKPHPFEPQAVHLACSPLSLPNMFTHTQQIQRKGEQHALTMEGQVSSTIRAKIFTVHLPVLTPHCAARSWDGKQHEENTACFGNQKMPLREKQQLKSSRQKKKTHLSQRTESCSPIFGLRQIY